MMTRFARLRQHAYADFLEDLVSKTRPDYIITLGNRGPHVVHAIMDDHPRLAAFAHTVHHLNATRFMGPELSGATVLLIDDTTYHGTSLARAKIHLEQLNAHVVPAAFVMCDSAKLRKIRAERHVPHIDIFERMPEIEYSQVVSDVSEFIKSRGPVTPADITRIHAAFDPVQMSWSVPALITYLSGFGDVSEHRYAGADSEYLSFSLHWPSFFDAGFVAQLPGITFDGVIKIRLRINVANATIDIIPMVHPSASVDVLKHMFVAEAMDAEFEALRTRFVARFAPSLRSDAAHTAYELLGFYLELRLARDLFDRLDAGPVRLKHVDVPTHDLLRYYGPSLGSDLKPLIRNYLPGPSARQRDLFAGKKPVVADEQGAGTPDDLLLPVPALITDILRQLRRTYRRWNDEPPAADDTVEPAGYTFVQLAERLSQSRFWTSQIIDYLCDATLLSPLNQISVSKHGTETLVRAYRAGEDRPRDLEAICAWVIWCFKPGQPNADPVPSVAAEKSIVALADVFHLFTTEPRIDTYRSLHGKRPSFMEETSFVRPRLFTLDTLPSSLYRKQNDAPEGYVVTERFHTLRAEDKIPLDHDIKVRLEDGVERLKKLYALPRRAENLVLLTMLASKSFGLDDAAADVELSVRHANEAVLDLVAERAPEMFAVRRALGRASEASGVAGSKLRILQRADELVSAARSVLSEYSTAEKVILETFIYLPNDDVLVQLLSEVRLLWRQALAVARALTAKKPPVARDTLVEALREIDSSLSRLMNRTPFEKVVANDDMLVLSHIGALVNAWGAALGNARHATEPHRAVDVHHAAILVVDVTGFVKASLQHGRDVFKTATMLVMNVLEGWLRVFGVAQYVYSREGDKLIVGFPHTHSAVAAAAGMMHHVRRLRSAGILKFGEPDACLKIGIDAGFVDALPNHDVISKAINIASRLCEHARSVPDNILLSAGAAEYLSNRAHNWLRAGTVPCDIKSGGERIATVKARPVHFPNVLQSLISDVVAIRQASEKHYRPSDSTP